MNKYDKLIDEFAGFRNAGESLKGLCCDGKMVSGTNGHISIVIPKKLCAVKYKQPIFRDKPINLYLPYTKATKRESPLLIDKNGIAKISKKSLAQLVDTRPCNDCDGTGKCCCPMCDDNHSCKSCAGTGKGVIPVKYFLFEGAPYNFHYLLKIAQTAQEFPDDLFLISESNRPREPLVFQCGQIEFTVMPVRAGENGQDVVKR